VIPKSDGRLLRPLIDIEIDVLRRRSENWRLSFPKITSGRIAYLPMEFSEEIRARRHRDGSSRRRVASTAPARLTSFPSHREVHAMFSILGRIWRAGVIANLVTGSLVVLPFVLTLLIIGWIMNTIAAVLGPGTWFGELLTSGGQAIVGQKRELSAFLIGAVAVVVLLWVLGVAVRTQARRTFDRALDNLLTKVPLFRSIYRPVSQVVRIFAGSNADLAGLPVVMCRLGGENGADIPAFRASDKIFEIGGDRRLLVYLPTSPLPAWGGLVLVRESAVMPIPNIDADALIKLYLSFGVLAPEILPAVPAENHIRA